MKLYFIKYKNISDSILNQLAKFNEFFLQNTQQPLEEYLGRKNLYINSSIGTILYTFLVHFEDKYILNLIELLQNKFSNKKTFAILFIKQFIELYNNFKVKQKNGLSSLSMIFPKLLKILLNKITSLNDYLEIANRFDFPVFEGEKDTLSFSYFIDFLQFKPVETCRSY